MEISGANDNSYVDGKRLNGGRGDVVSKQDLHQQTYVKQNLKPSSDASALQYSKLEVKHQDAIANKSSIEPTSQIEQTLLRSSPVENYKSARLDLTAQTAQDAIAAYKSTQYIEQRDQFTEVLGVDEFA